MIDVSYEVFEQNPDRYFLFASNGEYVRVIDENNRSVIILPEKDYEFLDSL